MGRPRTLRRSCPPASSAWRSGSTGRSQLDGYARIDFRLSADGTPYFLEVNPNPEIAQSQEFATAAKHDGLAYPDLLQRILALGMSRATAPVSA